MEFLTCSDFVRYYDANRTKKNELLRHDVVQLYCNGLFDTHCGGKDTFVAFACITPTSNQKCAELILEKNCFYQIKCNQGKLHLVGFGRE